MCLYMSLDVMMLDRRTFGVCRNFVSQMWLSQQSMAGECSSSRKSGLIATV